MTLRDTLKEITRSAIGPVGIVHLRGQPGDSDYIGLTKLEVGHAHVRREGVCGPGVTADDIRRRFYDPQFGGRDAYVTSQGYWGAIEHTD